MLTFTAGTWRSESVLAGSPATDDAKLTTDIISPVLFAHNVGHTPLLSLNVIFTP